MHGPRDARRHTNQQGNLSSVKYCVLTLAAMRLGMTFPEREMPYWHNARVTKFSVLQSPGWRL